MCNRHAVSTKTGMLSYLRPSTHPGYHYRLSSLYTTTPTALKCVFVCVCVSASSCSTTPG